MKAEEDAGLQQFMADNEKKLQEKPSGLMLIQDKAGKGKLPQNGDVVKVNFSVNTIDGQTLFSTFEREPMDITIGEPFDTEGFNEGITYLKKGERTRLIVPSKLAFDSIGRGQVVAPYTTLIYDVEVLDIRSAEEVAREAALKKKNEEAAAQKAKLDESAKIQNYIQQHNITVTPNESGLYYIETEPGTGAQAAEGKEVTVNYTLYNIEGKKLQSSLDSGQPFKFKLGEGQVIAGWDEGIALMKAGGKATLVIPSAIAYGATQRGADIPPYSPLVFEVELLEVSE